MANEDLDRLRRRRRKKYIGHTNRQIHQIKTG